MTHEFDKDYWESHWQQVGSGRDAGDRVEPPANPHLAVETGDCAPGTALDAGCGEGFEAMWLAARGWQVTAADISAGALARAAERAGTGTASDRVRWVEADLEVWEPEERFDLVTTNYAHPSMPQLAFYERISRWVAPGGTLLVVGHLADGDEHSPGHDHVHGDDRAHGHQHGHEHEHEHEQDHRSGLPPARASVTAASVAAVLDASEWEVVTADERARTVTGPSGQEATLHDVVVRAVRRG